MLAGTAVAQLPVRAPRYIRLLLLSVVRETALKGPPEWSRLFSFKFLFNLPSHGWATTVTTYISGGRIGVTSMH